MAIIGSRPIVKDSSPTTSSPTVNDDTADGYSPGSRWFNTAKELEYINYGATAAAAVWGRHRAAPTPAYRESRYYPLGMGYGAGVAAAVPTVDTVIHLYPFSVVSLISPTSLNIWVVAAAVGSAVKMGIWAHGYPTELATGVPLYASNTGQATTSNNAKAAITVAATLHPGVIYWAGMAFTTLAPTCLGILGSNVVSPAAASRGRAAVGVLPVSYSCPFTYSNDITALDLTSATFTDVIVDGCPIMWAGNV